MKVTIVGGAGVVGSCTAFRLAQDGKVSDIILTDIHKNLAEAHALDIEQAVVYRSTTRVRAGDVDNTDDSDIIVFTASVPRPEVELSRRAYLGANIPLVFNILKPMLIRSPSALLIIASSPVDPLVYLVHKNLSVPRERIIGLSRNDTSRFIWAIGRIRSVPTTEIEAYVMGEHGESHVPVFSSVRINGKPVSFTPLEKKEIKTEMSSFFVKWNQLRPGRTAGWASAESIGDIVASIVSEDKRVWPCSFCLNGEYGLKDVSLGVPLRFAGGRVDKVIELNLDEGEKRELESSARAIREMIEEGQAIIDKGI